VERGKEKLSAFHALLRSTLYFLRAGSAGVAFAREKLVVYQKAVDFADHVCCLVQVPWR
jgi:hypothetical protein